MRSPLGSGAKSDQFPALDSVRGLAALSVVTLHIGVILELHGHWYTGLIPHLQTAVTVFFVLSGFLLYLPFARAHAGLSRPLALRSYALRRGSRLFPGYWLALVLAGALAGTNAEVFSSIGHVARYFSLTQIYERGTVGGGLPQAWSLCLELAFYVSLPLLAFVLRRGHRTPDTNWARRELITLVAFAAVAIAWKAIAFTRYPPSAGGELRPVSLLLPGWLDLFGIGMAIAVARVWLDSTHGVLPSPLRRLFALPELCWVLAGALFVLLPPLNDAIRPRSRTAGFLQIQEQRALIALLIIAPLVLGAWTRSPLHGVLRMPWLRWTGTVSYGVYLWHWGILSWLADRGVDSNPVVFVLCGATLSLAAGAASWYVVEQPVLRWARGKERVQPRHTDDGPPVGTNLVRDSTVAPVADAAARSEVAADPG